MPRHPGPFVFDFVGRPGRRCCRFLARLCLFFDVVEEAVILGSEHSVMIELAALVSP